MKINRIIGIILTAALLVAVASACGNKTTGKTTKPSASKSAQTVPGKSAGPSSSAGPSAVAPSVTVPTASSTSSASNKVSVSAVQLDRTQLSLDIGKTTDVTAEITPSNASNQDLVWESGNRSVVTLNQNSGNRVTLTGVSAGSVIVTVTSADGSKVGACIVRVGAAGGTTKVVLDSSYIILTPKETRQLNASVVPANSSAKLRWATSDANIVKVSATGLVTAVAEGTATITVISATGGQAATCTVTVKKMTNSVTGVSLNTRAVSLKPGEGATLTATVRPDNADNKAISWLSSNTAVVTVDASGNIKAVAKGTATVTVTTADGGFTAICTVTVGDSAVTPVTGITMNPLSAFVGVGETQQLVATVLPSAAKDKTVTWKSSDSTKVTVSATGQIKGIAKGTATVTATTADGNFTASCSVTVS